MPGDPAQPRGRIPVLPVRDPIIPPIRAQGRGWCLHPFPFGASVGLRMGRLLLSLPQRGVLSSAGSQWPWGTPAPWPALQTPALTVAEGWSVPSPSQAGYRTPAPWKAPTDPPHLGVTHLFPQPPSTGKAPTGLHYHFSASRDHLPLPPHGTLAPTAPRPLPRASSPMGTRAESCTLRPSPPRHRTPVPALQPQPHIPP